MVSTSAARVIRVVTAAPVVQPASVSEVAKVPEVLNVAPAVSARSSPLRLPSAPLARVVVVLIGPDLHPMLAVRGKTSYAHDPRTIRRKESR